MVVCKVSVRGMFIGHRSVRLEEKCGLNGNYAPWYGLWSSGKVWLELKERKCSYGVICPTRLDMYLLLHGRHILSKVGQGSAIWCNFRQTNSQAM